MSEYLAHFGVIGMKWGVRRYQNPDGTLTEAGKRRYSDDGGETYGQSKAEAKYDRGRYLKESGRTRTGEVIRGAIVSTAIKSVYKQLSNIAVGTITKAVENKTLNEGTGGKIGMAVAAALKIGRLAANGINWGYRVRNISDMSYVNRSDRQYRNERVKNKILDIGDKVRNVEHGFNDSNYLAHYGIIGMKWGVRRTPEQLGHRSASSEERRNRIIRSSGSRNTETLRRARGEDISKLTNQQLQDYNMRLGLERNYAQFTEGRIKSGKDWVWKVLISGIVVGTATQVVKGIVKKWMEKKFGIKDKD